MTFVEELSDWVDTDGAEFELAMALGIFPPGTEFQKVKWVFWSDNPLVAGLHAALVAFAKAGIIEEQGTEDAWRWKLDLAKYLE